MLQLGSTDTLLEKLWRDMQRAHNALLEPTPSGKRHAADELDIPSAARPKRRAVSSEAGSTHPVATDKMENPEPTTSQRSSAPGKIRSSSSNHDSGQSADPWAVPLSSPPTTMTSKRPQRKASGE